MAQNKVTIDVEARFIDNVTDAAKKADKAVSNLDKKKPKVTISADDKATPGMKTVEKEADKVGKKKPKVKVDADDQATSKLNKILEKTKALANKVYSATIKVRDSQALNALSQIEQKTRSLAGKVFTATIKIKDLALAPLHKLHSMIFNIKTLIAGIFAGVAAQKLFMAPINVADTYTGAKIGFSTLLGEDRGQQMMNDLDAFAKATPFNTTQVIAQAQKMIAMGWDADKILEDMKTIGDAAAATGRGEEGLQRIVLALSQIRSKGKLSTEELNQLAEGGIAAKRYIAEGLGYGSGDKGLMAMTKDLEKGAIGAEAGIAAILEGMKEYKGMMDQTANSTVSGLKSQIEDAFEINLIRRWGQGLQDGAKRGLGSIVSLLDKSEAGLQKVGDLLYDLGTRISNWAADKLEGAVQKIIALTETDQWKNADSIGKIKILWDGLVTDPLKEWWEGGGQQKVADTMGKIGSWLGRTMTKILLTIFGATDVLNEDIGTDAGANIAGSFLQGFLDNFDGQAITDAFVQAVKNVWGALPTWAKVVIGGMAVGKAAGGISTVAGGLATIMGGAKTAFGMLGSANAGTGLLGKGAMTAIDLGAGNLAGGASMGGAALSTIGLGSIAGGIGGVVTAGSGIYDMYKGHKSGDAVREEAGAAKVLGAGGGAVAGAAIGSAFGGIGAIPGALIGAGIGSIVGWWKSRKIKKEAAEGIISMEELEAKAETTSEAADELLRRQGLIAESYKEHFGDLTLSLEEAQEIAQRMVLGGKANDMAKFANATAQADAALQGFDSSAAMLNRLNWRASIGMKFSDEEKETYMASVQQYIADAESAVEAEHFKFKTAVDILMVPIKKEKGDQAKKIYEAANGYYGEMQKELDELDTKLTKTVELALEDGKIDPESEGKVIADLQAQIAEIVNKVTQAESEAKMETLKIKFSSGELDYDSVELLQQEIQKSLEESTSSYDNALTTSITSLKLELDEGAINQEEYDEQLSLLTEGYTATIDQLKARATNLQIDIAAEAYNNIFGEGEDPAAKLKEALEKSLQDNVEPINWTEDQAKQYLGVETLDEQTRLALGNMLSGIADTLPSEASAALTAAGDGIAEGITPSDSALATVASKTKSGVSSALSTAFASGVKVSMPLDVTVRPTYSGLPNGISVEDVTGNARGGIVGANIPGYDSGGIVSGGSQLVMVAEEGSPEVIIPTSSQRRKRGLLLWEKAAQMMNIPGFARGGVVGGDSDEGVRFQQYGENSAPGGAQSVQVDVGGVTVEINVGSEDSGDLSGAIKEQANEIADAVAGILADAFNAQFANTPVRGSA